jgi:hypothetical protein
LNILKALTPSKILSEWKTVLSTPMFEAYKKDWDKYYLKPTKYACDTVKETLNKFDPFNWSSCSEWQYEDMLKELGKVWYIYIVINDNTTLGFEWIKNNDIDNLEWSITFSDTSIEKLYFSIIPNQLQNKDEFLKVEYNKNNNLDASLYAESWDIDFSFDSTLDRNNKFSFIDYNWKVFSNYEEFTSNFWLNNKIITWEFKLITKKYDYNSRTTKLNNAISWTISWKTNSSNELSNLEIKYIWDNAYDWQFLDWSFTYNNSLFSFVNNYYNDNSKSNIEMKAKWDSNNKIIIDWWIKVEFLSKQWSYDYETYKYVYTWDYEKNFDLNIDIVNKNIDWEIIVYEKLEELFKMNLTWNYDKDYFELNNNFYLKENPFFYLNQYLDELKWNFNFEIDKRYSNDNATIYFDINYWEDKILEFNLENKAVINYKDININTPKESETIDFEEIIY